MRLFKTISGMEIFGGGGLDEGGGESDEMRFSKTNPMHRGTGASATAARKPEEGEVSATGGGQGGEIGPFVDGSQRNFVEGDSAEDNMRRAQIQFHLSLSSYHQVVIGEVLNPDAT